MNENLPIIVGVDGSPASSAAIRFAAREAVRLGAPLHLVHVVVEFMPMAPRYPLTPYNIEETGRALLAQAVEEAQSLEPTLKVTGSLVMGPRVRALVGLSREGRMIMLGHDRHPTFNRLLTGATVTGVAAAAACPVVAVPPQWVPSTEHGCVVVGVKSTTASSELLRRGFEVAAEREARLVVLHAWELPGEFDDLITARVDAPGWQARAQKILDRAIAPFRITYPQVKVEVDVVHGQPAFQLSNASENADLLLLARRAHVFPLGHLGGTARTLLRHSHCPVAVLPPADQPAPGPALELERNGVLEK